MLNRLHIINFAIIDEMILDLQEGFTAITGETGAGKSIIIGALNLILGERASSDVVRTGCEKAVAEALFNIINYKRLSSLLQRFNITVSDEIVIRREILANGRGRCFINGQLIPLSQLKEAGDLLVDLHGQHQHQSLLKTELHQSMVDAMGGKALKKSIDSFQSLFRRREEILSDLETLSIDEREIERKKDICSYQLDEIDKAGLALGEDDALDEEQGRLKHVVTLQYNTGSANETLYEGGSESPSVDDLLAKCETLISNSAKLDPSLGDFSERLTAARTELQDIASTLRSYALNLEMDPSRLDEVENRLYLIQKLKAKYGDTIEQVLIERDKLEKELGGLTHSKENQAQLEKEKAELEKKLVELADRISVHRRQIGEKLSHGLIKLLKDLEMPQVKFKVSLKREEENESSPRSLVFPDKKRYRIHTAGVDNVEFLISPNSGEELKPLRKIASGGELSRIMLAFKALMRSFDQIPTLIFDEIDTGISGRTGSSIGEKMVSMSKEYQIICITHLPQIAVKAKSHFTVTKVQQKKRTLTRIKSLDDDSRLKEIVRLLGGDSRSDAACQHAKELLS